MSQRPRGEKSWESWKSEKSNPNIAMDEELVKNSVMDEEIRGEELDGCQNRSVGCHGSVHFQNWRVEQFTAQQSKLIGTI